MGIGSFDQQEEYDTDMKCEECLPPQSKPSVVAKPLAKQPAAAAGVSLASVSVSREVAKRRDTPSDEPAPKAEWYGPDECVGVWRDDETGSCVMETDCKKDTQINVYEFGMLCVDKDNVMTRHIFGMGSFNHKETFNTLIKCSKCLALDEYMDGDKAINVLTKAVKGMKDDLKDVSGDVKKLNAEVFAAAPGPAPAGASPAPAAAKPGKFLVAPSRVADVKAGAADLYELATAPAQEQQETPPAAQEQAVQKAIAKHEVVVQDSDAQEVRHVKVKASQSSATAGQGPEPQSVQDILAAAVKGAEGRGLVIPAADKKALGAEETKHVQPAEQGQKHPARQMAAPQKEDDESYEIIDDSIQEEDHGKDEQEDDEGHDDSFD
jgi:hypothetical protein